MNSGVTLLGDMGSPFSGPLFSPTPFSGTPLFETPFSGTLLLKSGASIGMGVRLALTSVKSGISLPVMS